MGPLSSVAAKLNPDRQLLANRVVRFAFAYPIALTHFYESFMFGWKSEHCDNKRAVRDAELGQHL